MTTSKGGRPRKYTNDDEMIGLVEEYLESCKDTKTEGVTKVKMPTIAGLVLHLNIAKDTFYKWIKDPERSRFAYSASKILTTQEERLINGSLGKVYDSGVSRLLLGANHGVVEKKEIDHKNDGESFNDIDWSKVPSGVLKELSKYSNGK